MRRKICVISEDICMPLDEGIKIFARSLIQSWRHDYSVLGISVRSPGKAGGGRIISDRTNKLFLSAKLLNLSARFRPDVVCYIPSASATLYSFLRCRALKLYWPDARVIMVSLQPRHYGWLTGKLIHRLAPGLIFVQDRSSAMQLYNLGCKVQLLPSGVDLDKFNPVTASRKVELRLKYGLQPDAFTVLHAGHIKTERGIELLSQVRRKYGAQVVLVGSSLPDNEKAGLAKRLREEGVVIFDKFLSDIQELYQLSDCYLFPVFANHASIGMPLSVLEAMACNLPVVTVRYGSLSRFFEGGEGLFYADTADGLLETIGEVKRNNGYQTRRKVLPYSWSKVAASILAQSEA